MQRNSSHISARQSSTTKRPRFSQPGTLTLNEILGTPSRPLRWLSPSTLNTCRPSPQGSSSSRRSARSNLRSRRIEPPCVETAGDTDTPIRDALPPTRRPISALHHTRAAHTCQNSNCARRGNNKPLSSSFPTSLPHCCTCGNDHTATSKECPARPDPARSTTPTSPVLPGQDTMDMAVDGGTAPSTRQARAGATEVDLVTPRQPPPAGPPRPGTVPGFGGPVPTRGP